MYDLSVDGQFAAAHFLRGYKGDCGRMHGHSWKVTITVSARGSGDLGMAIDFKKIAKKLDAALGEFDHQVLNEHEFFSSENPTAENIARRLFERLAADLNGEGITVTSVTVAESERYRATYRQDT
ncbi:MAG: 6-carboxytetrahydropterin synthase QueD [Candidatus Latescibacterota bacterium]